MKKFLSLMLCLVMLAGMLGITASADSGYDIISGDPEPFTASVTQDNTMFGGAAWANYYFACTKNGLFIFDINTGEQVAQWVFNEAATKLKSRYCNPYRVAVNDDYITVLMGETGKTSVVVFENPQSFDNTLPVLIGTFGCFQGKNPLLYMDNDDIWVVELRTETLIWVMDDENWNIPNNSVVCWKMNVKNLITVIDDEGIEYDASEGSYGEYIYLNDGRLYPNAVDVVSGGRHDYLWTESETDGTYIYYTTYNNTTSTPNKTVETHKFNIRDMSYNDEESHIVCVDDKAGMVIQFETDKNGLTKSQLRAALGALEVYEWNPDGYVPNEENPKLEDFGELRDIIEVNESDDDSDKWAVDITISDAGAMAEKIIFNMREGDETVASQDIVNGERIVAYTYDGNEYQFAYKNLNTAFDNGSMAIKDDYLYVFTFVSNIWNQTSNERTRMYILDKSGDAITDVADYQVTPKDARSNVISACIVGNALFMGIMNVGAHAYYLDISDTPDVLMSTPERIVTNGAGAPSTQVFRANFHYGRRIFYAANSGITGVLETIGEGLTIESASDFTEKAVYLYGFSNEEDGVTVSVDGVEKEVSSYGGVWALSVKNIKNGTHTITVTEDGEEVSKEVTTYSLEMETKETEISTAINSCADGEALVTYFEENPDAAEFLGLDTEGKYGLLDAEAQTRVMGAILDLVKNDDSAAVAKFEEEVTKEYQVKALTAVNDAIAIDDKADARTALKDAFEEYKDELFSSTLWTKYNKNSSKWTKIHNLFISYGNCDLFTDVEENLNKAITEANKSTDGGSGGGGGSREDKKEPDDSFLVAPKEPVEVYKPIQPKTFADVPVTHWAYEPITILATRGVINGMGDGNYAPETDLTREAFVKMLVEALGIKASGNVLAFTDVADNEWYTSSINVASSIGLVNGYDGKFGIGDGLTREQMATMLYRATQIANIKLEDKAEAKEFTDNAEIGDYALEAVKELCEAGIIDGMGDGSYSPKTICNRAMAAKVLYEILALQ